MKQSKKTAYKETKKLWNGRFEKTDLETWEKTAKKLKRSVTNLVEVAVNEYCKKHGKE